MTDLKEKIAFLIGENAVTPYKGANEILVLIQEALPELAKEAGYVKLAESNS